MSRRRRVAAVMALVVLSGGLGQATLAQALLAQTPLGLDLPASVVAGELVQIEVSGVTGEASLAITTAYGTRLRPVEIVDGSGSIDWRPVAAGTSTVTLIAGDTHLARSIEVAPAPESVVSSTTAAPERIFVGSERSLVVVAFVADRFGNPIEDGRSVDLGVEYPDGARRAVTVATAVGLAVGSFQVGTSDGIAEAWAESAGSAASARIEILPARPEPFALTLEGPVPGADGRSRLTLATDLLVDGLGNVIRDGTAGVVVITDVDGSSEVVPVRVVAGRLTLVVKAPAAPGRKVFVARLGGVSSPPLVVEFEGAR